MRDNSLDTFYSQPGREVINFVVFRTIETEDVSMDVLILQTYHHREEIQVSLLIYPPEQVEHQAMLNIGLEMKHVYAMSADDTRLHLLYKRVQDNIVVCTIQSYVRLRYNHMCVQ